MESNSKRPGRIITFYSYKGGTGRSMALANIAWILACSGKRVLTIDWDLEAPGLHRYFRPFLIDGELSSSEGLMELIDRYTNAALSPGKDEAPAPDWYLEYADFSDHILSLDFQQFPPGGKIDLLPAGRQSENYAVHVSSFNWQNFYERLGGGAFFDAVKARASLEYDYVLIDSRTGVSDTAGICTVQMPDTLVVCFTYNNQSIKGAAAVARSALTNQTRLAEERRVIQSKAALSRSLEDSEPAFRVFPVPMRVDSGESERLAMRQSFARESFAGLLGHVSSSQIAEYWSGVEVPHRVYYAYEEVLAAFKDDAHDPKTVFAAFLRLASFITDGEVNEYRLPISPEKRQQLLNAFAETSQTSPPKQHHPAAARETTEEELVRHADALLYALTESERGVAQQVLCRLVRLGRDEEGGGYFPIRFPIVELDEPQRDVVKRLSQAGLLTVSSEARTQVRAAPLTVEPYQFAAVANPKLVTFWPTLIRWLQSDREYLIWRQQLRAYLADWDRSGQDVTAFLSGPLLGEAQLWRRQRDNDLSQLEKAYIVASEVNAQRNLAFTPPTFPSDQSPVSTKYNAPEVPPVPERARPVRLLTLAIFGAALVVFFGVLYRLKSTVPPLPTPATTVVLYPSISIPSAIPSTALPIAISSVAVEASSPSSRPPRTIYNVGAGLISPTEDLPPSAVVPQIFVQYALAGDQDQVDELRKTIASKLKPVNIAAGQLITSSTSASVRYFFPSDEAFARKLRDVTQVWLKESDVRTQLTLVYLESKRFPNARPSNVELWLPALTPPKALPPKNPTLNTPNISNKR